LNAGTTLWLIILYVIVACLAYIIGVPKNRRIGNIVRKLKIFLFYAAIIRISLECYLELIISALINAKFQNYNQFSGEIIGTVVSNLLLVILVIQPFYLNYFLTKKRRILDLIQFKQKFGEFYE